ncbi:4-deoxy-L-threo-5-hexosulose-uronate ketol-isomerase [Rhodobacteraceae bacterium THAF1]|uniref:5-dehydro-4-deoxy-D-glucuronate isomerase n=1 Tax=Palleronia sp. THAF1 TaxID=2587842 RepID=UPI000F3EDF99|nr:5-dehydro-4-deoxy-D-glucuronate isomerase [Palleronia sp. THAF1]QFU08293.1 4-deoxy-L-threo-5-hexosulose-uronate ketol-isomerase [Palleronia sp. THAF1]VDC28901.1 4-deoxy-L-threo-5-hexosulose-uronate ketol-isomerase [Rhodobacteraceae bacterium THAF1]
MTTTWTTRYGASPAQIDGMSTDALRSEFLMPALWANGEARLVYTHVDRMVVAGICPDDAPIQIGDGTEVGTDHLFQAREGGIANLGDKPGTVTVDGEAFNLAPRDIIYVGRGAQDVALSGQGARFYLNSVPAGADHPNRLITKAESKPVTMGDEAKSNKRTLRMYIHPEVSPSCLLLMGITDPAPGSIWNTMPPHTHERRMEAYFYFDMSDEDRVMHFMGKPDCTRHMVVAAGVGVLSPAWSIHMGAGTGPYAFVWGMTGENQVYQEMSPVAVKDLK